LTAHGCARRTAEDRAQLDAPADIEEELQRNASARRSIHHAVHRGPVAPASEPLQRIPHTDEDGARHVRHVEPCSAVPDLQATDIILTLEREQALVGLLHARAARPRSRGMAEHAKPGLGITGIVIDEIVVAETQAAADGGHQLVAETGERIREIEHGIAHAQLLRDRIAEPDGFAFRKQPAAERQQGIRNACVDAVAHELEEAELGRRPIHLGRDVITPGVADVEQREVDRRQTRRVREGCHRIVTRGVRIERGGGSLEATNGGSEGSLRRRGASRRRGRKLSEPARGVKSLVL